MTLKSSISLKEKAKEIRKEVLKICSSVGCGHVTSTFSSVEFLVSLYYGGLLNFNPCNPKDDSRDRFILSKGQSAIALYYILGDLGFYNKEEVYGFAREGNKFCLHPSHDIPGVEQKSGSLGHGLGIASGVAYALKYDKKLPLVYCYMGDGECYEGSVWESAMFASHNRLNNLVLFIDRNGLSATDFTENMMSIEPLDDKWRAFGWDVKVIDGHSFEEISKSVELIRRRISQKPLCVIANTEKGRGIPEISNHPLWHMKTPTGDFADACMRRLNE